MWACQRCSYQNESDEAVYCGKCGLARYAEQRAAEPAPHRREMPPPPDGYLAFRRMICPVIIKFIYTIGLLAITGIGGYYIWQAYVDAFEHPRLLIIGLALLLPGNVLWRLLCENIILFFSMHEILASIEMRLSERV